MRITLFTYHYAVHTARWSLLNCLFICIYYKPLTNANMFENILNNPYAFHEMFINNIRQVCYTYVV